MEELLISLSIGVKTQILMPGTLIISLYYKPSNRLVSLSASNKLMFMQIIQTSPTKYGGMHHLYDMDLHWSKLEHH